MEDGNEDLVYKSLTPERVKLMGTTPFVLTGSCRYRFVISFRVNETIVNGWRFCTNVKKAVLATCDESCWVRMLHDPRATCLSFPSRMDGSSIRTFPLWEVHGQIRFVDDDHIKHLEQLYTFGMFIGWWIVEWLKERQEC